MAANRLIYEMQELVQRTVGPAIAVRRSACAEDLWVTLLVDPNQLENAILNLCDQRARRDGRTADPCPITTANVTPGA